MLRSNAFPRGVLSLHTEAAGTAPPDAFGPFRVLHQIGAGTLGPVFRAYEPTEDRLVAVKWLRLDLPPDRAHRLVAELEALIALDVTHPGIASPIAAGLANVWAFLAQDFVAADSLDILLRDRGPAPIGDAVRIATQLAVTLDFAAEAGVLHGTLHPRDVLVTPDDARVTGLGVAKALEQLGVTPPLRRPYSAPERAAGEDWDRRADVFSLAAVTYELISGKRVTATGDAAADVLSEIAGPMGAATAPVFAQALADDPSKRFDTARAFALALQKAVTLQTADSRLQTAIELPLPLEAGPAEAPPILPEVEPVAVPPILLEVEPAAVPPILLEVEPAAVPPILFEVEPAAAPPILLEVEPAAASPILLREPVPAPAPPVRELAIKRPATMEEQVPIDFRQTVIERSRSAVWPLALAAGIGLAVGFAGGYGAANRNGTNVLEAGTVAQAASGREYTEAAIPRPQAAQPTADVTSSPAEAAVSAPSSTKSAGAPPAAAEPPRVEAAKAPVRPSVAAPKAAAARRVTPPTSPQKTSAPPVSGPGSLFVDSRPPGTSVFLDNKMIGTTPLLVQSVPAGNHTVRLEREGYRRWSTMVDIGAGERSRVTGSLER